jgi:drug/metabolite transporter (DMT)-like permease
MNTVSPAPSRWHILAAMAAVYLIWGSTYLGIRYAIETIPPLLMAGSRFVTAGLIVLIWQWSRGAARPTWQHWRSAAVIGGLMMLGGNGGVTWAEQHVPSGLAALVIGAVPIWIVMLNWLVFGGARPNGRMALGLASGLIGVMVLIGPAEFAGSEGLDLVGAVVLMGAAISWAIGSLYSRRAPLPTSPMMATGMEMLAGGILQLIAGTLLGEWSNLNVGNISLQSATAWVYLGTFGSLIGFSAYIWLLRHTTPARAASYAYVNPVVAVFLGWAVAGEAIAPRTLIAAAIIIGSVVLITSFRAQSEPRPRPRPAEPPMIAAPSEVGAAK